MRLVPLLRGGAVVVGVVIVAVILLGGSTPYRVTFKLSDADGLRNGAEVTVGDVPVGTVSLRLGRNDQVLAQLELSKGRAGAGASIQIVASNLLGSKYVALNRGNLARPLSSGSTLPSSRVSYPVDLDQVLNVLDANTRTRLEILINEVGIAVTGRGQAFNQLVQLLPNTFTTGATLLSQLVADNHTLAQTVAHSSRFVSAVNAQRSQLVRLIDATGTTMQAVAERQAALRGTLAAAPPMLTELQGFLDDLRSTTAPLGPAAQAISLAAPKLNAALEQLTPFTSQARPALREATADAPLLSSLAVRATPIIEAGNPALQSLATFSSSAVPLTNSLNSSIDNVAGVLEGWGRSIQSRDGVSHYFRGTAVISPDVMLSLVRDLQSSGFVGALSGGLAFLRRVLPASHRAGSAPPQPSSPPASEQRPSGGTKGSGLPAPPAVPANPIAALTQQPIVQKAQGGLAGLLHYLLGK